MQATPTYLINKVVSSMDPTRPVESPHGWGYATARSIRDYPFKHPLAAGIVTAAIGPLVPFHLLHATIWAGASAYATGREAIKAAPAFAKMLERIGRRRPEFTAPMIDTKAALTMRQASMRAIHDSGYLLQNVLTREARMFHR